MSLAFGLGARNVLIGFDDLQGLCGPPGGFACPPATPSGVSAYAFSTDFGVTWTNGGEIGPVDGQATAGHTKVDVMPADPLHGGDLFGDTFFLTTRLWNATTASPLGLEVFRGHFGFSSFTWDDSQNLAAAPTAAFSRPTIVTAKNGSRDAYVVETDSIGICDVPFAGLGQIEVWRTHDGGDTWQGPVVVSPEAADIQDPTNPDCGDSGPLQVAAIVAVGPLGEVYVAWQFGPRFELDGSIDSSAAIYFSRSRDGGVSFDPPRLLVPINSNLQDPPVGYGKSRLNDQARFAVVTSGPHFGRVYMGYYAPVAAVVNPATSQSLVSIQSYLIHSDDEGVTWSTPTILGPPVPPTGIKRIWPTIALGPLGEVDVAYLESQEVQLDPGSSAIECSIPIGPIASRTGTAVSLQDTFLIQSFDGGNTFGPPQRISTETTNWCTTNYKYGNGLLSNLGDYFDVQRFANLLYITWPDGRSGFPDVFFAGALVP